MRGVHWKAIVMLACLGGLTVGAQARQVPEARESGSGLGFKMLSHPSWRIEERAQMIIFHIEETPGNRVSATIQRSWERPLAFEDLVPSALQNVYGYADHFFVARLRIHDRPVLHIEAHPQGRPEEYLLDYFLLHNRSLYRVSFYAETAEDFRRYQMLFLKMINSFQFVPDAASAAGTDAAQGAP